MTLEKAQKDFNELIAKNGFTLAGHTGDTGTPIYHKIWTKHVQAAWHGEQQDTLEIRILLSYGYPLVVVKRNGKQEPRFMRDYSSPKRAMNAIKEILRCAGFDW